MKRWRIKFIRAKVGYSGWYIFDNLSGSQLAGPFISLRGAFYGLATGVHRR